MATRNRAKEPHAKDPRKLQSGRWQARVTYYDPETGKRLETSKTFDTERAAKKWGREQEMQYREDPNRKPPSEETVGAYLNRWLTIKSTLNLADKTLTSYREMAAHSMRELGGTSLKSLTPLQIQQFYAGLAQTRHLSARTIRYVHTVLKMALNDAVEWGLMPINPANRVKVSTASGVQSRALRIPSPQEMAQLLQANQDTRWYPLWVWFVTTGSRLGEALALRWGDIDWDRRTVTIQQAISGDAAKRVIKTPKTASGSRTLALGPRLVAVLKVYAAHQQEWRGLAGGAWHETGLVFTTLQGKMLSKRYIDRAFKAALKRAGLPDSIRVHDLRHGVATQWLSAGVNPVVVSKRLGHSNVAFTLQVYGHVLPGDEDSIVATMEDAILPPSPRYPHEPRKTSHPEITIETTETL